MLQTSTTRTVHNGSPSDDQDWRHRAACRDEDPELFHPVGDDGSALIQIGAAKAVCACCPVVAECLSFALVALPHGVAGGLTAEERAKLRRTRRRASTRAAPVDPVVVAELVAGQRVPRASAQELAQAAIEPRQGSGRGSKWIAARLGVHDRQVYRWIERHKAGKPLTGTDRCARRVSASASRTRDGAR